MLGMGLYRVNGHKNPSKEVLLPHRTSESGFILPGQELNKILLRDYKVIQRLKEFGHFDYRDLAYILSNYIELLQGGYYPTQQITIMGDTYMQQFISNNSGQTCPWNDESEEIGASNYMTEVKLTDVMTRKSRYISSLLPHLIEEHWFFEGNPLYRVAPEEVVFLSLDSTPEQKVKAIEVGQEFPL